MARLFVAVWPPARVVEALAALPRPELRGVRWVRGERLHVTLRFLGDADSHETASALRRLRLPAAQVRLGPHVRRLGRGVLMIPAAGLDAHAGEVAAETAGIGRPPPDRRFVGHLTIARCDSRPPSDYAPPFEACFTATELALVRTEPGGAYTIVDSVALSA